jgi:hypothetical protein
MRYSNSRMMNVHIVLKTLHVSSSENVHISFVSNVSIKMINVLYVNYFLFLKYFQIINIF